MGNKDCIDRKTATGPHHLLLRSLAAVEQERVGTVPDHDTGRVALGGWQRPGSTEEIDLQGFTAHRKSPC
jgi:hypothetical protein